MDYAKILLSAYPNLGAAVKAVKENYLRRCYNSAYFSESVARFSQKVLNLFAEGEILADLKDKLDLLVSRLTDEEKDLFFFKYCGIMPKNKFDFSLRTYFRKQIKLQRKIETFLGFLNITEEVFKNKYMSTEFFRIMAAEYKSEGRKKQDARVKCALVNG